MTSSPLRPLAEMPLDGIAGIFCDLDDTLTWKGALVPQAYSAICEAVNAGLRVVIATGRAGGWAEVLSVLWPVAAVVAENGAYAVLRDGSERYWDDAEVRRAQMRRMDALAGDAFAKLPFVKVARDIGLRRVDLAFDLHEHEDLAPAQVDELASLVREHGARVLVSSIHLHAYYGTHDKAAMLARIAAELWGEDEASLKARYLFVGDSPNDQAGFAFFPRSVGVANVGRHVAALAPPPAWVTREPGGHGFAQLIDLLLAVRA